MKDRLVKWVLTFLDSLLSRSEEYHVFSCSHGKKTIPLKVIDPLNVSVKLESNYFGECDVEYTITCDKPIGMRQCEWCDKRERISGKELNRICELHNVKFSDIFPRLKRR